MTTHAEPESFARLVAAHPEFATELTWYLEIVRKHGVDSELAKERSDRVNAIARKLGIEVVDKASNRK